MDKQQKEELQAKINDFSYTAYLIRLNKNKEATDLEKEIEEKYKKLEKWILENVNKQNNEKENN